MHAAWLSALASRTSAVGVTVIFELGRLPFAIEADHPVGRLAAEEFASVRTSEPVKPRLTATFCDELRPLRYYSTAKPVTVTVDRYQVDAEAFSYQVERQGDGSLHLTVAPGVSAPGPSRFLPPRVRRFLDWTYHTDNSRSAKHFVYEMFDYLSQIAQLQVDQTYLHASAVGHGSTATIFAAWGGIGKTSAMLQLVKRYGCQFLADDLAVIHRDGMVYRHPKRMQIYAYNLIGMPQLDRALHDGRSSLDKLSWRFHLRLRGTAKVRRRVAAEGLFDAEEIGSQAKVERVLWLTRTDSRSSTMRDLSLDEFVHRAAWTLVDELNPFAKISAAVQATGSDLLPTVEALVGDTSEVLAEGFANLPLQLVSLPEHTTPQELADYLVEHADVPAR